MWVRCMTSTISRSMPRGTMPSLRQVSCCLAGARPRNTIGPSCRPTCSRQAGATPPALRPPAPRHAEVARPEVADGAADPQLAHLALGAQGGVAVPDGGDPRGLCALPDLDTCGVGADWPLSVLAHTLTLRSHLICSASVSRAAAACAAESAPVTGSPARSACARASL